MTPVEANTGFKWTGPIRVERLLKNVTDRTVPLPPDANGVYLVSRRKWTGEPCVDSGVLYVGSTTGKSNRFRTRVGDLLADLLGFYSEGGLTGHHSGGVALNKYCGKTRLDPQGLWIGWLEACCCPRCMENAVYDLFVQSITEWRPKKSIRRPSRCKLHAERDLRQGRGG